MNNILVNFAGTLEVKNCDLLAPSVVTGIIIVTIVGIIIGFVGTQIYLHYLIKYESKPGRITGLLTAVVGWIVVLWSTLGLMGLTLTAPCASAALLPFKEWRPPIVLGLFILAVGLGAIWFNVRKILRSNDAISKNISSAKNISPSKPVVELSENATDFIKERYNNNK